MRNAQIIRIVSAAGLSVAAAAFPQAELAGVGPRPEVLQVQIDPDYSCIVCHTAKRRAFVLGVHSERGIRCHDCHGGDPTAFEQATAHAGADYVGTPDKLATIDLCASCHSNPDQMREYGLQVGQLAEYRTSRHGKLLLEQRNTDAPTCTDCHDAHTILPPNDARSSVYPTNIVRTCARCHQDAALMAKYGIPTDQVAEHRSSAHGVALFDDGNFAAPTCADCHGSHAALPPAVVQIANVCGQCHVLTRRAFFAGPHGQAAQEGAFPGCTACHSNHGTERVPPDQVTTLCVSCHAADSEPARLAGGIQREVTRAAEHLERAREAVDQLARAGRRVTDTQVRYETARTAFLQMDLAQHDLDLVSLEDLGRQVSSITQDIRGVEEVAAEHRWEHKLLLIPVWFLALSGVVLAWFKLRALAKEES